MAPASIEELRQAANSIPTSLSLEAALRALESSEPSAVVSQCHNSLEDVANAFVSEDSWASRGDLLAILSCINQEPKPAADNEVVLVLGSDTEEGEEEDGEEDSVRKIGDFVAKSIAPIFEPPADEDEGYHPTREDRDRDLETVTRQSSPVAEAGLAIISSLLQHHPLKSSRYPLSDQALLTAIAYCDPAYPWSASPGNAVSLASETVNAALDSREARDSFVVEVVLRQYLRSLFSKSRPAAITASGRKAEFAEEPGVNESLSHETRPAKPWKYIDMRAVSVFTWTITVADRELISKQWHLFTPVLLALIDDASTDIRAQGLRLLPVFLAKMPGKTLVDTGLDSVFQEAVFPTLLFLPELTPEAESLQLQDPAYDALIALARTSSSNGSGSGKQQPNLKLLDKALRDGAFAAFFYAREYVRIVEVLARQAGVIVGEMGIHAAKHLKELIPMLASIMDNPFATSHPQSLKSAIATLQVVIANCWPRLGQTPWREEIIKALVVCWLHVQDDLSTTHAGAGAGQASRRPTSVKDDICADLTKTAAMLAVVVDSASKADPSPGAGPTAAAPDVAELVAPLIAKEPLLRGLFAPATTVTNTTPAAASVSS